MLEMPRVPSSKAAADVASKQEQPAAAAPAEGEAADAAGDGGRQLEAPLPELPSVPKTRVQLPPADEEKAGAEEAQEPDRVLVAA